MSLGGRCVFFVKDAERSLKHYTETLGFTLDWTYEEDGRPFVFQVSLQDYQLILNQTQPDTEQRPGHGRIFFGIDDDQVEAFREHILKHRIKTSVTYWGNPTLVIHDLDENELFFWFHERHHSSFGMSAGEAETSPSKSLT